MGVWRDGIPKKASSSNNKPGVFQVENRKKVTTVLQLMGRTRERSGKSGKQPDGNMCVKKMIAGWRAGRQTSRNRNNGENRTKEDKKC